ncbi:hypothetical protein [Massilia endophytica]|uniref:hypothetical protein n=1 Tax=Massilia endophytica TaxID=2899220 RepID=UPI001E5F90FE|nr:hypothetical protein [Massilia endophytica]UGQ48481.1 hypothetical protein LSQ66_08450 [Massilia endophytica]
MQIVLVAVCLHVLSGVFWAGSTFVLARPAAAGAAAQLFRPQMGAAAMAVLTGAYLGHALRAGTPGTGTTLLIAGAVAAIVAAGIQGAIVGRARRKLRSEGADQPLLRQRMTMAHRIAGALLAFTVLTMASARFL